MTERNVFAYIRFSSSAQEMGDSLTRQREGAKKYASALDLGSPVFIEDIAISAHTGKHRSKGELGKFINNLNTNKIDSNCILLVENMDRLSREEPTKALFVFADLLQMGVEIHTISDRQVFTYETFNNDFGKLIATLAAMQRSHSESRIKSERLRSAWRNKRKNIKNEILTSIAPSWLKAKADKTGFEVIEERAYSIRKIFELCINQNMGAYSITRYLNDNTDMYPSFGKKKINNNIKRGWTRSYVSKILNNVSVYGIFCPKQTYATNEEPLIISDYYPSIISKDDFTLAAERIHSRKKLGGGRKGESHPNLFTKLVTCSICKGPIHYYNKGPKPKGGRYLQCYNSINNNNCRAHAWNYELFENSFFKYITELNFADLIDDDLLASEKKILHSKIETNNNLIRSHEEKIEVILSLVINSTAASIIQVKINALAYEIELKQIENQENQNRISAILSQDSTNSVILKEGVKSYISKIPQNDRAKLGRTINANLHSLIKQITLNEPAPVATPPEAIDMLSAKSIKLITKLARIENSELEEYLTIIGYKRMNYNIRLADRTYTILFKSGGSRLVSPALQYTLKLKKLEFVKPDEPDKAAKSAKSGKSGKSGN